MAITTTGNAAQTSGLWFMGNAGSLSTLDPLSNATPMMRSSGTDGFSPFLANTTIGNAWADVAGSTDSLVESDDNAGSSAAPSTSTATATTGAAVADHHVGTSDARASAPSGGAATATPATDAHPQERQARNQIMEHMLAGSGIGKQSQTDLHRRQVISSAMDSYSLDQLKALDKNHVKFRVGNLSKNAPEGQEHEDGEYKPDDHWAWKTKDGQYVDDTKKEDSKTATITLDRKMLDDKSDTGTPRAESVVRHEMAHAWDDAQSPDTIDDPAANPAHKGQFLPVTGTDYQSETGNNVYTDKDGKQWSIQDMYNSYKSHADSQNYIGNEGTPTDYAGRTPQEFYAEGYSVFHGNDAEARTRMQKSAPELYQYLLQDARQQGTVPAGVS